MNSGASRSIALSVLLVLSLVALTTPATAVTRPGTDASTTNTQVITDCTVIDSPGSYALGNNVTSEGSCIEITASDVVLDGQGYTLESTDRSVENFGIHVDGTDGRLSNVTVRNVAFEDWNWGEFGEYGRAVLVERVTGATVTDLHVNDTDRGIELQNTTESTVRANSLRWAGDAEASIVVAESSNRNDIADNTITAPGEQYTYGGIRLTTSLNNTIENNTFRGSGIQLRDGSDHNAVTGNLLYPDNQSPAIRAGFSENNTVVGNEVYGPGGFGISLDHAGEDNVVADNLVNGTGSAGISVYRVDDTVVRDNDVVGTNGDGIVVEVGTNNTVQDNTIGRETPDFRNNGWGVNGVDIANSTVRNNSIYLVGGSGIRLSDSAANNSVVDNAVNYLPPAEVVDFATDADFDGEIEASGNLVSSGLHGIQLANADDNTLTGNTIRNGYRGFEVVADADNNTLRENAVYELNNETEFALRIENATGTTVDSLDIGNSTAGNTTISLTGQNVTVNTNETAVDNPDAVAIDRYVEATNVSAAATLTIAIHYEYDDVAAIDRSTFALWRHGGGEWHELNESGLDTDNRTVSATVNESTLNSSTAYGAFGQAGTWPTPTATPAGEQGSGTDQPAGTAQSTATAPDSGTTTGDGPGFGVAGALVAVVLGAVLLGRRA